MVWCGSMMMAGALDARARLQLVAREDGRLVPCAGGEKLRAPRRLRQGRARGLAGALAEFDAAANRFDRHRLDHHLLGPVDEAEACLVRLLEGALHRRRAARRHHQRGVGAGVADMRTHEDLDLARWHALAGDFVARLFSEPRALAFDGGERLGAEHQLDRLLARGADIGEPHAIGRQQRRERMDQHLGHAERIGDEAGVLAAGAAEAVERVARHVVAALHRNLLDRVRHVLDRDLDEAVGDLLGGVLPTCFDSSPKAPRHRTGVERLVLVRPENLREEIRHQLAGHHIGVGDRQRPVAAVTFRSRIGARRIRPDAEAGAVEMQDRTAARRDRVDQHHRRAHAHAGDLCLEGALVFAVEMRHVGRGAAHVEADQPVEAGLPPSLGHADHAARRSGQDRVLALEQIGGGEPARRHHEHQADVVFSIAACRA